MLSSILIGITCCGLLPAIGAESVATLTTPIISVNTSAATTTSQYDWISGRIAGGQTAQPHSAPWIVSLQWGFGNRIAHSCGGSIISVDWVVTAAHCLGFQTAFGTFVMLAGRHNLRNGSETGSTEQRRRINRARTFRHPSYVPSLGVGPWDIALVHVAPGFVFSAYVGAIALPTAESIPHGEFTLHGWGSVSTTIRPSMPNELQTVTKPSITMEQCMEHLPARYLHASNLCTGPLTGGVSACGGDSGGPLEQNGQLIGVVSWGVMPCGSRNAPSVYVRVSAFIDWIREIQSR